MFLGNNGIGDRGVLIWVIMDIEGVNLLIVVKIKMKIFGVYNISIVL